MMLRRISNFLATTMFRIVFRMVFLLVLLMVGALLSASPLTAQASSDTSETPDIALVLDASGSMWGQIDGENKIVIARRVLKDLLTDLDDGAEVGLIAYGHRREGDCRDVETIAPLAVLDRASLGRTIDAINPKGKTPITFAIETAVDTVRSRAEPTTIILVSDGLETCDGDPCQAVRVAKEAGIEFVLHVVGFGIEEGDVSQLECAAQAGGGLYFDVESAEQLSAALDQVVRTPVEVPDGRLSIRAIANGELVDVGIRVSRADTGEEVAVGRTYTGEDTNPRSFALADGTYDVVIGAVGMRGDVQRRFEDIEIRDGSRVDKEVDFSSGTLAVTVTRNGELSDATVRVVRAGTRDQIASGRTYTSQNSNPKIFELTAGEYDVEIGSVEIADSPEHKLSASIQGGQRQDLSHAFESGDLRVGARQGESLVDAVVRILDSTGREIARRRTYTDPKSNPASWKLQPGTYRVEVGAVKLEGKPKQELEVRIGTAESVEKMVEFVP